MIAERNQ